jgi:hypothetical protein
MDYFEVPNTSPDSFAFCSDNECPCSETRIPPGGGYMYISQTAVDFRKDARSVSEVESLFTAMPAILQQALFQQEQRYCHIDVRARGKEAKPQFGSSRSRCKILVENRFSRTSGNTLC